MIYLDVTSACQSVLNTGVRRMQRGLHEWLHSREDYQPVYWQSIRGSYRRLVSEDFRILERTWQKTPGGWSLYDSFLPWNLQDLKNKKRDSFLSMEWPVSLKNEDIVLVPDLLWDSRSFFFTKWGKHSSRKVGIFHDAIGLRRPEQSRIDAYLCSRGVRALADFDLVICISKEAEADLIYFWKKFGLAGTKTHVAPWPVPFTNQRPEHKPHFSAASLLYVARLEKHKNHLLLLDVCERLWKQGRKFDLRLIGCNAYPYYSWRVQRRVKVLRRQGYNVRLQPHISEDELHEAYRKSSFTVFPSLLEGFGLPIIESLWHGRPVVCGNKGALGEVAAGGGCKTVNPEDSNDLSRAIVCLLSDEQQYNTLYRNIQQRPMRSWSEYWTDVNAAINEIRKN
ncbi:MAG: glycosyltransferase family 4 protein [Blastochloris sp.]|nr:glycosyltransferase family 4 protein [Blastochloris sp.]